VYNYIRPDFRYLHIINLIHLVFLESSVLDISV
jgi:hypothetical protein